MSAGNGRLLLICPSRDRPKELGRLVKSALDTSEAVDVAVYIDEDQRLLYDWLWSMGVEKRIRITVGPRVGPVAAVNAIAAKSQDYMGLGFMCDDCAITTPGWDRHVLWHMLGTKLVAPFHDTLDVDMPFISREWYEALGWFAWPGCYHWGWPSILAGLAAATPRALVKSKPGEFFFIHPPRQSMNRERYPADIIALYDFFACHFEAELEKLKGLVPA